MGTNSAELSVILINPNSIKYAKGYIKPDLYYIEKNFYLCNIANKTSTMLHLE